VEAAVDLLSVQFLSALMAIVIIDLVLAGDNAIVIALAARNVAERLRTKAILWGTVGAIVVRTLLTMVVVWLLAVPGLLFAGGALLIWIAYKLLLPEPEDDNGVKLNSVNGFWAAIRTIVVADIVMGLDNVLAVAGAAHGSFMLVALGLLISIPIVVWGSTVILRFIDRYPAFVYLGAGVLAWTAAKMMTHEPLLASFYDEYKVVPPLMYMVIVVGVLAAGFFKNHRRIESRITAHLARLKQQPIDSSVASPIPKGDAAMQRILVPVDGSPNSQYAVRQVINEFMKDSALEVHLLNVQPAFSRHIANFVSRSNRHDYHRAQGQKALGPIKQLLENHGVPYAEHLEVGDKAALIAQAARRLRCDRIVMSTARKNSLTRMLEDSTTNRVLEATDVPVEIIAGDMVSPLERFGVPAGLGAAIVLLLMAAD
jgi:YjbE family integral membrane protein